MKRVSFVLVIFLLAILMLFSGCRLYTVVPMAEEKEEGLIAAQQDQELDPKLYVEENWEEIVNYTLTNAYAIDEVISAYNTDKEKCIKEFSSFDVGEADTATFIVQGQVKILEVNRDSKVGKMGIDVMPYDDVIDAYVYVGPVYKGNTVRDTVPFIIFEDFKNQLAFGDVGKAMNTHIDNVVVIPFGLDAKVNEEIMLNGMFAEADADEIMITPVSIEAAEVMTEEDMTEEDATEAAE